MRLLRARRLGLLPWLFLGPSLILMAMVALSTICDRLLPWREARAAVSARRPSLTVCTSLTSQREYVGSTLVSGSRERSYLLFFLRSWPTSLTVRQALPIGTFSVAEAPGAAYLPAAATLGFLVGFFVCVVRYLRPDVLIPNAGAPHVTAPPQQQQRASSSRPYDLPFSIRSDTSSRGSRRWPGSACSRSRSRRCRQTAQSPFFTSPHSSRL